MSINQNTGAQDYAPYKEKQKKLSEILSRSSSAVAKLNMTQYTENLKKLQEKLDNDTFKIQIVGSFSNGKSTFINSFLGEEILPAYNLPTTAVINEVKYGEQKKAVLHFCNPIPKDVSLTDIPERAYNHMKRYNMNNIPPLEIHYDEIERYVVIPMGKDPQEAVKGSPFEMVELFWPMELLKNGVEIIDSPGLNEAESRTKVTMEYLTKADAIIFLLRADQLCSQDEMNFIEYNLKGNGFENPFFVINRFDLIREREKEQMKAYAYSKLRNFTSFGESGFYFVSALNALDGKIDGDKALYEGSGMPEFEKRLSQFLTKEKGMVKLSQPAREIKRVLYTEALNKVIPRQRVMLDSSLDDVKKKYELVKPKLRDLQQKKDLLKERLNGKILTAMPDIKRCVTQHISDLSRSIPAWCSECEPITKVGMIPSKDKISKVASEVAEYANGQLEKSQLDWKNNTLSTLIEEKVQSTFGSVESDIEKFFDAIDTIQVEITGKEDIKASNVSTWKRVAGVAGGLALGDVGLAMSGGMNGIGKDFAKTLAIEVGAGAVLALLGLFNPITIGLTLVGVFFFNKNKSQNKATENIKTEVSNQMIQQLNQNREGIADNIISAVSAKFNEIANTIINAVDIEIKEVDKQINGVMDEMKKGQANIDRKKSELTECKTAIEQLIVETDDFVDDLIKNVY